MKTFCKIFLLCFALHAIRSASAQTAWEPLHGPDGVQAVSDMQRDGSGRLFMLINNRVMYSEDNGSNWMDCMAGLVFNTNFSFDLIPAPAGGMYLFQEFNTSLYHYSAATNAWTVQPVNLFGATVEGVDIDPQGRIWCCDAGTSGKLFYSDNAGQSFAQLALMAPIEGMFDRLATKDDAHNLIAVSYGFTQKVYHFTQSGEVALVLTGTPVLYLGYNPTTGTAFYSDIGGFMRSTDGGLNWENVTVDNGNGEVENLFFDEGGKVWAIVGDRLFLSADDGISWALFAPFSAVQGKFFQLAPDQWLRYSECSLFRTTADGLHWQELTGQFLQPLTLDIKRGATGILYARTCHSQNIYKKSLDDGLNWSDLMVFDGNDVPIHSLAVRADGAMMALGVNKKVYRSNAQGLSWQAVPLPGSLDFTAATDAIYVSSNGSFYYFPENGNVHRTADEGNSWEKINLVTYEDGRPVFLPNGDIYVATLSSIRHYTAATNTGVWLPYGDPGAIYAKPDGTVFFADYNKLYRILPGSQEAEFLNASGLAFVDAITSFPDGQLFSISYGTVYHSLDNGVTWSLLDVPLPQGALSTLYGGNDQYLYAGFKGNVIHRLQQTVADNSPAEPYGEVIAYPNPFRDEVTFEIRHADSVTGPVSLQLFDAQGRLLRREIFSGKTVRLPRSGLPKGLYFYLIEIGGKQVAVGKVVAE